MAKVMTPERLAWTKKTAQARYDLDSSGQAGRILELIDEVERLRKIEEEHKDLLAWQQGVTTR